MAPDAADVPDTLGDEPENGAADPDADSLYKKRGRIEVAFEQASPLAPAAGERG